MIKKIKESITSDDPDYCTVDLFLGNSSLYILLDIYHKNRNSSFVVLMGFKRNLLRKL